MVTDLPETKKGDVEIDTTEKGWFSKAVQRVREQEKKGKLDPDLNLTVVDTTDIFSPVDH